MQSLYEWDFRGRKDGDLMQAVDRNVEEFASGLDDTSFIYQLIKGVIEHLVQIDAIIEKAAPQWPLDH